MNKFTDSTMRLLSITNQRGREHSCEWGTKIDTMHPFNTLTPFSYLESDAWLDGERCCSMYISTRKTSFGVEPGRLLVLLFVDVVWGLEDILQITSIFFLFNMVSLFFAIFFICIEPGQFFY